MMSPYLKPEGICIHPEAKLVLEGAIDTEITNLTNAVAKWLIKEDYERWEKAKDYLQIARALLNEIKNMDYCSD